MLKRPVPRSQDDDRSAKRTKTQTSLWKTAFERGRTCFADALYEDAIAEFSSAIDCNQNITLYDCRAAAFEKVGQYAKALEDAMTMIKMAPDQSKGYLRAGKVLVIQERFSKAIAVYNRALKYVNKSDSRYAMLETMRERAKTSMKQRSKENDFTKILPYDILHTIFAQVSFDRRIQCMAVCQSWRNFLKSWFGMWCRLHFTSAMSVYAIKQYMSYTTGRYVRQLCITGQKKSRMNTILQLGIDRDCHYIQNLEIVDCQIPVTLFLRFLRLMGKELRSLKLVDTGLSLNVVVEHVFPLCPGITQLIYHDAHPSEGIQLDKQLALTHLSLSGPSNEIQKHMIRHCPQLICLSLYSSQHDDILTLALRDCPNLIEFSIAKRTEYWETRDENKPSKGLQQLAFPSHSEVSERSLISAIEVHHGTLEVIDIRGCYSWSTSATSRLISRPLKRLRELYIQSTAAFSETQLCELIRNTTTLETVHMQSMPSVTNAVLEALAEQPFLRRIDLSNCPNVTGLGIRQLLHDKRMIRRLVINNCSNIRPDAVSLAREKLGRNAVEFKFE
ncbi:hypothetical protein O0I10_010407 [Lichtheimia ornata]|uniref:F-box domain-containing protein n=1 Tax=Lichtheimia ornata TaxID=688661 RepID=A0AAD7UUS2_9FUNG|nr:uncharacterized protein O0I10_010407 [Lichtheimia ornata]KAJ8653958.1 hypothetical protein O0I10_010407 [Lichtheimia ornata]